MRRWTTLTFALILCGPLMNFDADAQKRLAPLPIEEVVTSRTHAPIPVDLSPDGLLLAYTTEDPRGFRPIQEGQRNFTATGVPMSWGGGRSELWITNTETGEITDVNADGASSWAGVWSPDGQRLAFFSDRSGGAGLWVWERVSKRVLQLSDVIVRPYFYFEVPAWTPDGGKILCKVLPEGMTLAEAAGLIPTAGPRVEIRDDGQPSVFVLEAPTRPETEELESTDAPELSGGAFTNTALADLALIDLETGHVQRIVRGAKPRWSSVSPDGKNVGFTTIEGWEVNSQQPVYGLHVYSLAEDRRRTLVPRFRQGYGISVSWSPDGRHLSYLTGGQRGGGDCFLVPVTGGDPREVTEGDHPSFAADFRAPLWDRAGDTLYFLGAGAVWKTPTAGGAATEMAGVPRRRITEIVGPVGAGRFWSPDGGRSMIVTTRDDDTKRVGFYTIDLKTGACSKLIEEDKRYGWIFSYDVSRDGRLAVYGAEDAQHPHDYWSITPDLSNPRRVTTTAPVFDGYEMGSSRLIEWLSADGKTLRGTLLLPAGYREGTRYPLVVMVYGGGMGSNDVNRFGLSGGIHTFNMQVLATRGHAVLSPDAPLDVGTPLRDLADTVLPGVNRVVELGIADPDRLAVMGQSYGSYSTLALLVQTTRFKAAIISAVVESDLIAGYLHMNDDGSDGTGYYEEGQGGMGGTPWEFPDRWISNSPVFSFDRIETPLLMAHGTMDGLPMSHPDHTFVALRRLGKRVRYLQYGGEGHVVQGVANTIDFWERRIAWLEEHLTEENPDD